MSHHIVILLSIALWAATSFAQVSPWESETPAGATSPTTLDRTALRFRLGSPAGVVANAFGRNVGSTGGSCISVYLELYG
jgi:hypothetical protein